MIYPFSQFFSCNSLEATQAELLLLRLVLILFQSLVEVKLNKDVLGLHPKNPTRTSLVLEDHSTDYSTLSCEILLIMGLYSLYINKSHLILHSLSLLYN
jgi:hypothetical protein